jgi:hypothetical protein
VWEVTLLGAIGHKEASVLSVTDNHTQATSERTTKKVKKKMEAVCSSFSPEGGVGLVPKRGCLLTLAYIVFPT